MPSEFNLLLRSFQQHRSNDARSAAEKPQFSAIPAEQLDPLPIDQVEAELELAGGDRRPKVSPRIPSWTVLRGHLGADDRISTLYFIRPGEGDDSAQRQCYRVTETRRSR